MYRSDRLRQVDEETFTLRIPKDRDFKILQLTDLHLGFGILSRNRDKLALDAVRKLIKKSKPDLIVLTGDSIFPFLPKSGTLNNRKQAKKLMAFLDSFEIPYTLVFGNHDSYQAGGIPKEDFSKFVHAYNKRQPKEDTSYYFKANSDCYGLVVDGSSYVVPGRHGRYLPEVLTEIEKLFKYKKNSLIFVFQHFPLIPPNNNESHYTFETDRYLDLLKKYPNVVLVASGHFHYQNLIIDENGLYHISVPALGSRANSTGSGIYEVVKVTYDKKFLKKPENVKINVKDVKF